MLEKTKATLISEGLQGAFPVALVPLVVPESEIVSSTQLTKGKAGKQRRVRRRGRVAARLVVGEASADVQDGMAWHGGQGVHGASRRGSQDGTGHTLYLQC